MTDCTQRLFGCSYNCNAYMHRTAIWLSHAATRQTDVLLMSVEGEARRDVRLCFENI